MPADITKPHSHIYWLWIAYASLVATGVGGYIHLIERGETMKERIASNELKLQVQLVEIRTKLVSIEATLQEIKGYQKEHQGRTTP
ncbi:MAG: hypothetical protein ACOX6W_08885 [Lentisphaeria bacterium]|jgi:hypothetical protein